MTANNNDDNNNHNNNKARLPESIAQAISEMHVSLRPESYQPLYYKSLPEMAQIRDAESPITSVPEVARDVIAAVATIANGCSGSTSSSQNPNDSSSGDGDNNDNNEEYLARCACALILLGHGMTDEAHDLVSPLSWPNELPFAYGPPVAVAEQVLSLASYVHALVHRREGPYTSEFNMTGFSNADYWAGSALRSPEGAEALPLDQIRAAIMAVATTTTTTSSLSQQQQQQQQDHYAQDAAVQQWVQHNVAEEEHAFPVWDPRVLNELCSMLYNNHTTNSTSNQQQQQGQQAQQQSQHSVLLEFAEQAVLAEMKVLLKHTLQAIGYDV